MTGPILKTLILFVQMLHTWHSQSISKISISGTTKISSFPHILGNQTESQQAKPQKMKTFFATFSLLNFIVKKKWKLHFFFQLSYTFLATKHNHKTYLTLTSNGVSDLHFQLFSIDVDVRNSTPMVSNKCREKFEGEREMGEVRFA